MPASAPPSEGPLLPPGRAALVHDWFQGFHGSERVVDVLLTDVLGTERADVLTFSAARELLPAHLSRAIVRESRLAQLPGVRQRGHSPGRWRYLLPYMPRYFAGLDLSGYELVVTSSHAAALGVRPPEGVPSVCYCHTPMRYAWLPDAEAGRVEGLAGVGLRAMRGWLQRADLEASRQPDVYVANSTAVRERIRRIYGRDAEVIHPPVDVADFTPGAEKEPGHFLWVHRLVSYKHPLVVAEAFRGSRHRLTMVGIGPLEAELRQALPPNVELHGWLEREELAELYRRASGFIHVGEEDFGIAMVEALAAGMPVIGLARGGACDIVRPGIDGILVDRGDVATLRAAVDEAARTHWDPAALAARARRFSREEFVASFAALLAQLPRR